MKKRKKVKKIETGHVKIWLRNDMPNVTFHGAWQSAKVSKREASIFNSFACFINLVDADNPDNVELDVMYMQGFLTSANGQCERNQSISYQMLEIINKNIADNRDIRVCPVRSFVKIRLMNDAELEQMGWEKVA